MELERLHAALEGARDAINVRRVYGEPIERDGVLVIPAASVRGGGGGGGGGGTGESGEVGEGQGFGFGMEARPAGAFVIDNGDVRWEPAVDRPREIVTYSVAGAIALFALRALLRPRRKRR
ncbi:MAG TPA: spore germination protein GerW family protein [Acidimicrobiia bacterium]|nr:spore germination protein GerW family protein [Acidimicrobiia bacterium]